MRVRFRVPAPAGGRFTLGAFDGLVAVHAPLTLPGGDPLPCTLVAAAVSPTGSYADLTVEAEPGAGLGLRDGDAWSIEGSWNGPPAPSAAGLSDPPTPS